MRGGRGSVFVKHYRGNLWVSLVSVAVKGVTGRGACRQAYLSLGDVAPPGLALEVARATCLMSPADQRQALLQTLDALQVWHVPLLSPDHYWNMI